MYLAEELESEFDVTVSEKEQNELEEFMDGLEVRAGINSTVTVSSPSKIRVVLSGQTASQRDLEEFAGENITVVEKVFTELRVVSEPSVTKSHGDTTVSFTIGLID